MVNTYDEIFDAALSLPLGLRAMLAEIYLKVWMQKTRQK